MLPGQWECLQGSVPSVPHIFQINSGIDAVFLSVLHAMG